jgi:hypothetical protein
VETLEDRAVPASVVTISNYGDAKEDVNNGQFYVSRTGSGSDMAQGITVNYNLSGSAINGTDFSTLSGTVSFAPFQGVAYINVVPTSDTVPEYSETVLATLTSGTNYTVGSPGAATVIIFDDDGPLVMVEKINEAVEGGTDGKFTVSRMGDIANAITVNYSLGGTATNGTDYTTLSGSVTIAAGAGAANVLVDGIHDGIDDDGETVVLTLASGTGYTIDTGNDDASLSIIDADLLPVAFDWWVATSINTPVEVDALELSTDLTPDTLTLTAVTQGADGSVSIDGDSVIYTPDSDFVGDDSFTYTVEDPFGNESTGTITVTVTQPIAPPTSAWTAQNTAITIEVLEMAFDPDGDELTTTAVTQGTNGSVVINQDGTVTYTPNSSFTGDDSFTYTVEDPDENEATHTITVTVGPIDPVALDDSVTTPVNTPVDFEVEDLAFDPEGDTLEVTAVTQGANGTVAINLDGSITYTPDTDFEGTDSFTYTVEDEDENPSTGTIEVTVGDEPEGEVDEIIDDLEAIEEEIEEYEDGPLDDITNAVPTIVDAISEYLEDVESYIGANSIDPHGANKLIKEFVETEVPKYKKIYNQYMDLQDLETSLYSTLAQNSDLIWSLGTALKSAATTGADATLIAALQASIDTLMSVQKDVETRWTSVCKTAQELFIELRARQRSLNLTGVIGAVGLPLPPVMPGRSIDRIVPKLP